MVRLRADSTKSLLINRKAPRPITTTSSAFTNLVTAMNRRVVVEALARVLCWCTVKRDPKYGGRSRNGPGNTGIFGRNPIVLQLSPTGPNYACNPLPVKHQ